MQDFFASHWPWLVACLVVGAATGAVLPVDPQRKRPARWLLWFALAAAAGVAAVALGAASDTLANEIEIALAFLAAFLVGAAAGALAFRRSLAGHERWAIGLIPAALLWWGAAHAVWPGLAPPQEQAAATAAGARKTDATASIAAPSAATAPAASQDRHADLAALPAGALDAAACQRALDAVAEAEPVVFRAARSTVDRRAALALDKAAAIIRRCPDATIEVRGPADADADADRRGLSFRRARAAERYLRREGVSGRRLVAAGCCEKDKDARRTGAIGYILR